MKSIGVSTPVETTQASHISHAHLLDSEVSWNWICMFAVSCLFECGVGIFFPLSLTIDLFPVFWKYQRCVICMRKPSCLHAFVCVYFFFLYFFLFFRVLRLFTDLCFVSTWHFPVSCHSLWLFVSHLSIWMLLCNPRVLTRTYFRSHYRISWRESKEYIILVKIYKQIFSLWLYFFFCRQTFS